jgi:hypothetical protein
MMLDSGWRRIAIKHRSDLFPFLLREAIPVDQGVALAALQSMGLPNLVRVRHGTLESEQTLDWLANRGLSLMLLEAVLPTRSEADAFRCRFGPCFAANLPADQDAAKFEAACKVRVLTPVDGKLLQAGLDRLLKRCLEDSMIERDGRWNLSWLRQLPTSDRPEASEGCTNLSSDATSPEDDADRLVAEQAAYCLLHNDRLPAVLLDRSWRVLDEPHRCPSLNTYQGIATESGYCLRSLVVPDTGGYLHLLFLARSPKGLEHHLMETVSARGAW